MHITLRSLYTYLGGNDVRYVKLGNYFLKDGRIPSYFGTKYVTLLQIGQILHNSEGKKTANFLNLEQVNFRVTLVIQATMRHQLQQAEGFVGSIKRFPCPIFQNASIFFGEVQSC